ncbi:AAA family ATPase [Metamycoplasma equirhinis]|uniref:AAA family ATPase n=2 Tax=Metamycoplasma equirhinis TaxID=92402 RepID=UPI0035932D2E
MLDEHTLNEVANIIKNNDKKITVLYAFNSTGKTRLSMEFKNIVNENNADESIKHVLYYNAFTEDLFSWDNDLENDTDRKLKFVANTYFIGLLKDLGKYNDIKNKFASFSSTKIEPNFNINANEITFSIPELKKNNDNRDNENINIKISKGEESVFIWTLFYVLIENVIDQLNLDPNDRSTHIFDEIKYIFIDDPVSSLDDNNLIKMALHLAQIIKNSKSELKFIITTHHALFFNLLFNEFNSYNKNNGRNNQFSFLRKNSLDEFFTLSKLNNDTPFSYHLFIRELIKNAIKEDKVKRYHFMLFRNLLEKTALFLGYSNWKDLFSGENKEIYAKYVNIFSHNKISDLENNELSKEYQNMLKQLFEKFDKEYKWKSTLEENKNV